MALLVWDQHTPPPDSPLRPARPLCSCADALLRNLYRWVCSPASRLYDPNLKQVSRSCRAAAGCCLMLIQAP
jgi:hypothetical protein